MVLAGIVQAAPVTDSCGINRGSMRVGDQQGLLGESPIAGSVSQHGNQSMYSSLVFIFFVFFFFLL